MKFWHVMAFLLVFSCSHQGDRGLSSVNEDTPEVPEDYRQACLGKGGDVQAGDCQCLKGGKFIDPYAEDCPSM